MSINTYYGSDPKVNIMNQVKVLSASSQTTSSVTNLSPKQEAAVQNARQLIEVIQLASD